MLTRKGHRTRLRRYRDQHWNAKKRGIPWLFSYVTWRKIWAESGKWNLRGCNKGQYCMSRPGDKGPYAPWNVYIIKHSKNASEGNLENTNALGNTGNKTRLGQKHTPEAKAKMSVAHKGKTIPFTVRAKITKTLTGQKKSTTTKRKMSIAQKARWEREKIV